jgi:hypothetical protein
MKAKFRILFKFIISSSRHSLLHVLGYLENSYKGQKNHVNIKSSKSRPDHSIPSKFEQIHIYCSTPLYVFVALHSNTQTSSLFCLFLSPFTSSEARKLCVMKCLSISDSQSSNLLVVNNVCLQGHTTHTTPSLSRSRQLTTCRELILPW